MGCASSIHISDRVVYHSGKESEDCPPHSPPQGNNTQNCPIKASEYKSSLNEVQFGPMKLYEDQIQLLQSAAADEIPVVSMATKPNSNSNVP
ncbi:hypothetical protein PDJAM_G00218070 [Pangasius djambal]|uniref:Uncharacterized protein n=1 Tax=Pangasius djambal TaxID=1691987 RepID=A0ACC5YBH8_9TELE|nr:hypothetical protein [Pangasius djambal]